MYAFLNGWRVLESSAFVAAPLAGMTLAQLGCEVIRLDPPGGGLDANRWPVDHAGNSLYWAGLNKGKKSIVVDVRKPEGAELAQALATAAGAEAGLLLTNLPLRGWLDEPALRALRGDLILAQVKGNRDGSSAVDYTVNCATGFPLATGPEGWGMPVNNVLPAWDAITGVTAALGIVVAQMQRRVDGQGRLLSVALSDVAIAMAGNLGHIAEAEINGASRPRLGNAVYGAFGADVAAVDGRRLMVVAITLRQWRALGNATGLAGRFTALGALLGLDLDREGDRFQAREAISLLLRPWCATRTMQEIGAAFDAAGVCWGQYQSFAEMVAHDPRCSAANPMLQQVMQPGIGQYLMPGSPLDFAGVARDSVAPAPRLGQHTEEVLAGVLNLPGHAIAHLHDSGVVACVGSTL